MHKILFYLMFLSIMISCKSQQYAFEDLPSEQIVFGKGGGITGASDRYVLLKNGQLFHASSLTGENKELKNIGKEEAKAFFNEIYALKLSEIDFDHPGNIYYFLEEVNEGAGYKVTWGSNDHKVPNECQESYDRLRTMLK